MDEVLYGEVMEAEVPDELAGERADRVAAKVFAEHSRALLSRWIKSGALLVDGEMVKPNLDARSHAGGGLGYAAVDRIQRGA